MSDQGVNIKFVSIELLSKSLFNQPILKPGEPLNYLFNFIVDIKLDVNRKLALVMSDFTVKEVPEDISLASFKTACVFEFPEFDTVFKKVDENMFEVPEDMEILLKSAGVSTSRGIIFSELRGTYLHGVILPLIDIATPVRIEHEKIREKVSVNP